MLYQGMGISGTSQHGRVTAAEAGSLQPLSATGEHRHQPQTVTHTVQPCGSLSTGRKGCPFPALQPPTAAGEAAFAATAQGPSVASGSSQPDQGSKGKKNPWLVVLPEQGRPVPSPLGSPILTAAHLFPLTCSVPQPSGHSHFPFLPYSFTPSLADSACPWHLPLHSLTTSPHAPLPSFNHSLALSSPHPSGAPFPHGAQRVFVLLRYSQPLPSRQEVTLPC